MLNAELVEAPHASHARTRNAKLNVKGLRRGPLPRQVKLQFWNFTTLQVLCSGQSCHRRLRMEANFNWALVRTLGSLSSTAPPKEIIMRIRAFEDQSSSMLDRTKPWCH